MLNCVIAIFNVGGLKHIKKNLKNLKCLLQTYNNTHKTTKSLQWISNLPDMLSSSGTHFTKNVNWLEYSMLDAYNDIPIASTTMLFKLMLLQNSLAFIPDAT